jgi:hypothetical protein
LIHGTLAHTCNFERDRKVVELCSPPLVQVRLHSATHGPHGPRGRQLCRGSQDERRGWSQWILRGQLKVGEKGGPDERANSTSAPFSSLNWKVLCLAYRVKGFKPVLTSNLRVFTARIQRLLPHVPRRHATRDAPETLMAAVSDAPRLTFTHDGSFAHLTVT